MLIRNRSELHAFVNELRVPASRREVILAELEDHAFQEIAEAEAAGLSALDAERLAFVSLGPPEALRARFERANRTFGLDVPTSIRAGLRLALLFLTGTTLIGMTNGLADIAFGLFWPAKPAWALVAGNATTLASGFGIAALSHLARFGELRRALRGEVSPWSRTTLLGAAIVPSLAGIFLLPHVHQLLKLFGIWTDVSSPEVAMGAMLAWAALSALLVTVIHEDALRRRLSDA